MPQMIFVNLPVADLKRSRAFYGALGYTFNERFSDDTAACCVISDTIFLMLMIRDRFAGYAPRPVADATTTCAALFALNQDSREAVDRIIATAVAHGGSDNDKVQDMEGFMYSRSFGDPDGHVFEPFWMNPTAVQGDGAQP